jgi:hypothetical protein
MLLSALRGLLGCGACFHPPCSADVGEAHATTSVPVVCRDNTVLEVEVDTAPFPCVPLLNTAYWSS